MKKTKIALGVLALVVLASCKKEIATTAQDQQATQLSAFPAATATAQLTGDDYVQNEVLIKFKDGTTQTARANVLHGLSAAIKEHVLTKTMQHVGDNEGFYVVNTSIGTMEAITHAKAFAEVVYAEPNYIYKHDATSNDTYYTNGSLWGMYGSSTSPSNQYGSNAAAAWNAGYTGSSSVYVGIIDEGADYNHEDLAANFWTNPYDPVDGIDNDGNGYVDDIHGWNFVDNNNNTYDASQDDHGTHVSGTIGGIGGNGKGVAGINWRVTLLSAKFLGPNGGTTANAVKAVDYLTDLKRLHKNDASYPFNLVASNNSWGGGSYSQALYDAIERANAQDILFVAAAGNGNQAGLGYNIDKKASYPASYTNSNIIAVAAISSNGSLASFSNYGASSVDIGAPGVGIYSTLPNNTYGSYSGTSMATPHVTGTCALYASVHPGATAAQIKNAIIKSATPTSSLRNKCVSNGRLNTFAALSY